MIFALLLYLLQFAVTIPQDSVPSMTSTSQNSVTISIPIPTGCTAAVVSPNVVITCPLPSTTPPPPALMITTPIVLPAGKVGVAYSVDISKLASPTGGVAPYTYTAGANFPAWLKLSAAGILTGIPTAAGTYSIQFNVTDSSDTTKTTSTNFFPSRIVVGK